MDNQKTFTVQMGELVALLKGNADQVVRSTLMKMDDLIVDSSPVGDGDFWKRPPPVGYVGGRYRGAWMLSLGTPIAGETGILDKDGSATKSAHASVAATMKAGDIAYLVNNVPYAKRIEDGWAKRAPNGVVGLAVMNIQQFLDRSIAELKK